MKSTTLQASNDGTRMKSQPQILEIERNKLINLKIFGLTHFEVVKIPIFEMVTKWGILGVYG